MDKISQLPDYPAIQKLAAALHQVDANLHGAAIMIGAGFSRSSAHHVDGEKKMPLWNTFSKKLAEKLNPNTDDLSFSDPLRIAEEFRAYCGQAALNDQIRFQIEDEAWRPGPLYQLVLKLPWAEIMTTNWDTLLERAAKEVHSPYYTTITNPSDLTWAPSPRIVKLHGTVGTTNTFIAAQEDYRTYPQKFAPFVNFARQVFIENELCLLGFSGDDPNFLHWAGWVRDHLTDHARKIYLVGALNLTAARRKHLESINIAPIDMWDAVKHIDDIDLRHQTATEWFLQAMIEEGKSKTEPHKWSVSSLRSIQTDADFTRSHKDPEYAATLLKGQLETLRKDRERYPGWLVCPPSLQWQLKMQLSSPYPNPKNLAALAFNDRAKLLYEIAWRYDVTFEYIPPWLAEALFQVANPDEPNCLSKRQQLEIILVLLKNSRWIETKNEDNKSAIQHRIDALIAMMEKYAQYLPDCAAELAYYRALVARDALDYAKVETLIEKITGEDPVWKLRQSALLMEIGRFGEGKKLVASAYGELRDYHRRDRYSISVLSRVTWAHWLLECQVHSELEELPAFAESNYRKWKCDPWSWIDEIRKITNERQESYLKNLNPIEPNFGQGCYRDNSTNYTFNNKTPEVLLLEGLSRSVGVPLYSDHVNLLAAHVEKLVLTGGVGIELLDYTLAVRAAHSESSSSIKDVFTRIGIAKASQAVVDTLISRLLLAISYWREKRGQGSKDQQGYAISALRVFIEVLARLVVRTTPERAREAFQLAVSLGQQRNLQHFWLSNVLESLLTYSLNSIPESEQGELLANALGFPLQAEVINGKCHRWPNPVIDHPNERSAYPKLSGRINELVEAVTLSESETRTDALLRLLPLVEKKDFLTQTECEKLASALWGSPANYQVLPQTSLFPHALLLLPAPDKDQATALVLNYLYEHNEDVLLDTNKELRSHPSPELQQAIMVYSGIAYVAANKEIPLYPSENQALRLFDLLTKWRPWKSNETLMGFPNGERERLTVSISEAISYAIVPALPIKARSAENFLKLQSFYSQVDGAAAALPALVYFVNLNEQVAVTVEKTIRKAMQSRDSEEVHYAAVALQKWMKLDDAASSAQLNGLVSRLIVNIESGRNVGLHQLLWIAGELFKNHRLSEDQISTLTEAVPYAFSASDYENIEPKSQEAISASSIREMCVKLAGLLVKQGSNNSSLLALLEKAKTDPLPEVRFALQG